MSYSVSDILAEAGNYPDYKAKDIIPLIISGMQRKEEEDKQQQLADLLKNIGAGGNPYRTMMSPQQEQAYQYLQTRPDERNALLQAQEQAVREKQAQGGTFTNEDLVPYQVAGIRSPLNENTLDNPLAILTLDKKYH